MLRALREGTKHPAYTREEHSTLYHVTLAGQIQQTQWQQRTQRHGTTLCSVMVVERYRYEQLGAYITYISTVMLTTNRTDNGQKTIIIIINIIISHCHRHLSLRSVFVVMLDLVPSSDKSTLPIV